MPVQSSVEVAGVKEVIKALRAVDPELKKEFVRQAKSAVAPMVASARAAYPQMPLSGMGRNWQQGGRQKFPWELSKVRSGVKVKTSTRRDKNSVVYVSQGTPAGAIFEVATTGNRFGANLRATNSRVLWPAYDRHASEINQGIEKIVREAEKVVQGMVR